MRCYFCEKHPSGAFYHLDNGRILCSDCLAHITLGELLDALELYFLGDFLLRFHVATLCDALPYIKNSRRDAE